MRIIYIIKDINFLGGAHVATANLIRELKDRGIVVDVLSSTEPTHETMAHFGNPHVHVWHEPYHDFFWALRGLIIKCHRGHLYPDWVIDPTRCIRNLLQRYDCVCVMSETDPLRALVSRLPQRIRKVQMIHNDYKVWSSSNRNTQRVSKFDHEIYGRYDAIAFVGEYNARQFASLYPDLAAKTHTFYNVIPTERFRHSSTPRPQGKVRVLTLSRAEESQKASSRSVRIACRLAQDIPWLEWSFVGEGYDSFKSEVIRMELSDRVLFRGPSAAPEKVLAQHDCMVLLSHYEGVPMVIYESFLVGTPVFATRVGGLPEQVDDGVNGWLVEDDERSIVAGLSDLLTCPERLDQAKQALRDYRYDNADILSRHIALLTGGRHGAN